MYRDAIGSYKYITGIGVVIGILQGYIEIR